MGFEDFMPVKIKVWSPRLRRLIDDYRRFGRTYCINLKSSICTLKMDAVLYPET
jgi:hypothetical protein